LISIEYIGSKKIIIGVKIMAEKKKYDLAVAYRIYPGNAKTSPILSEDKLKFSELCLKTFVKALGNLRVKIWVILDNCPTEFDTLFHSYFSKSDLELIHCPQIGNHATFKKQIDILINQDDSEYIYFGEDDYIYLPDSFPKMLSLIKNNPDVHFVNPYDHREYYHFNLHNHHYSIKYYAQQHWRTAVSTTCTFLTSKRILKQTWKVFNTYYTHKNYDHSIWMSLTKYNVLNPVRILYHLIRPNKNPNMNSFKMIGRSWMHCSLQILFGKKWNLWTPIPALATHMHKDFIAPNFNDNFLMIRPDQGVSRT
jgi:hypothetical protein